MRRNDALEVANFTDEGACCDDSEAGPEAPYETAQNRENLVSEELCSKDN